MTTSSRSNDLESTDAEVERAIALLVADARDARAAGSVLSASSRAADQRYADEVATTLTNLEFDLRAAKAALGARRAGSSDDLHGAMADLEQAVRAWLDDISLQAGLGRLELRDHAEVAARRIDRAGAEARRALSRVSDAVESDLEEMRRVTLHSIGDVRAALADAFDALRKRDD